MFEYTEALSEQLSNLSGSNEGFDALEAALLILGWDFWKRIAIDLKKGTGGANPAWHIFYFILGDIQFCCVSHQGSLGS